ncbi:MAG: hypothetical protein KGL39_36085 [Patescibacteria group bacterium]|nr:hypothetical protein [Patescibacteria group bacterium]
MKCPICKFNELGPATLNPDQLWCSVCAVGFDQSGKPLEGQNLPDAPGKPKPTVQRIVNAAVDDERGAIGAISIPGSPIADVVKSFHVTIGNVSFQSFGKVELDIAGTKVVIT